MSEDDRRRWDERYASGAGGEAGRPSWLDEFEDEIPQTGRALDVAAGVGRVALWLCRRGLHVTAVDISEVGLARAREAAGGLPLATQTLDLEDDELPPGPFQVVSCFHYCQRELFPAMRERLAPGGVLVLEMLGIRNLERHPRPSARWLLGVNEALSLCAGLEIVSYREGWMSGRYEARVVARAPAGGGA